MNPDLASQDSTKDGVIKLKCPECSGGLNLRRKHLGISGKCVHCKIAITAVEEAGTVSLKRTSELEKPAPVSAPAQSPAPAPVEEAAPSLNLSPEEEASRFVPPTFPELPTPATAVADEAGDQPASTWGFPTREESSKRPESRIPAPAEEEPEPALAPEAAPDSFSKLTASASESLEGPADAVDDEEPSSSANGFGFSMPESAEANVAPAEGSVTESQTPASMESDDLFESKDESPGSALFSDQADLNENWGAKVPSQNHASISPFSTGSAEPDPGFAETLFREKAKEETGKIQPKSPFPEPEGGDDVPLQGGALFSQDPAVKAPKPEEDKEMILDGDGRPLREMTPEEKENFAQDIMHFGDYKKRSPWMGRILKFVATITVLSGIGYAAYVFMPEDQVEVAKAKVLDWLEPGSVLMQYLPFEVSESEDGEKGVKIKALEGLDNLSGQMDQYLTTAEGQLNETLPEGAEGYEREEPIDTPEMPQMPDIPGLKMPDLPGMGSNTAEAAESSAE